MSADISSENPPVSMTRTKPEEGAAIVLRGVSKLFAGFRAVDNLTLTIPRRSSFGLIGPNGAGKTTTFSMLAGFLAPSSGQALVLDHAPSATRELKGHVGVLPQDALLPSTEKVGPYLMFLAQLQGMGPGRAEKATRAALEEVEGSAWWEKRMGSLSHGMAKRVGIAQALLGDPELVLLDEPTAGLDPRVAFEIRQIIKRRRGSCTLVVSSHNLQELEEVCDHAAIMDHGKLVLAGTMSELTATSQQLRIELAPGPVPLSELKAIQGVTGALWDETSHELTIHLDAQTADTEEMIQRVLTVLLTAKARISGLSKGKRLEQRVMELTD